MSRAEHALTPRQVEILAAAGQQIGIAIDNTSLLADTRRAADEALALYRLGTEITASLEVEKVVAAVAHGAQEVLASDLALVAVLEADHKELVVQAVAGHLLAEWRGLRVPVDQIAPFDLNAPVGLAELPADLPPALETFLKAEQITSLLIAPLMRGDRPYGAVVALARSRRVFSDDEVRLLTRLAQQVVVAIENAQLYQQVRHLAVLEERDRLAREMHDNLAQALGYLNLKASLTTNCLSNGEVAQAQAGLQEMKQITRAAYTDTREAIFNLRHAVWLGAGLLPMLRDYLAEYRAHYGLDVRLIVEQEAAAEFSTEVAAQLSRIVQEALTNIRKHAQAAHASVRFEREADQARIVIQDDGRGFELAGAGAGGQEHFGLQIMRERAASVGGTVEFEPQIGKGTRVVIRVPLQADQ
jgi:signal transduction histidine kinase